VSATDSNTYRINLADQHSRFWRIRELVDDSLTIAMAGL
jgi:hypothetical protein